MAVDGNKDILAIRNVYFTFSDNKVNALNDLNLELRSGELTFLLGENGAGKSTLARLCCGFYRPKKGYLTLGSKPYIARSPKIALRKGVALVPQHPDVVPKLKVWQNLALAGHVPGVHGPFRLLRPKTLINRYDQLLRTFGLQIDLECDASSLSASEIHWLALAQALVRRPRFLFLDEPTAPYTIEETKRLYTILKHACSLGMGVVIITHRLSELTDYAQRVIILKKGNLVFETQNSPPNLDEVKEHMFSQAHQSEVDHEPDYLQSPITKPVFLSVGEEVLNVSALSLGPLNNELIKNINFTLFSGEIVGIYSPMGKSVEALEDLFSGMIAAPPGCITINKKPYPNSPIGIRNLNIRYIPSRRFKRGIAQNLDLVDNLVGFRRKQTFKRGIWNQKGFMSFARYLPFSIKKPMRSPLKTLSGGMIQKLILNRELGEPTSPLIFCFEPSWGLDSRLQAFMHDHLKLLAERGSSILIVSSDKNELKKISSRTYQLKNGHLKEGQFD